MLCKRKRGMAMRALSGAVAVAGLWLWLLLAASAPARAGIIDGLVGNWTFDISGNLGDDSTANNNDGTAYAGVSYSTGSQGIGAGNSHVTGSGAALFNGTATGYVRVPDSASLDSAAGTALSRSVAFWFKTTANQNLVVLEKGTNTHFVIQTEGGANAGKVSWRVDTTNTPRVFSSAAVNDGLWHHFAATYSGAGNVMELYIDGIFQGANVQASPMANNSPLVIGARDGGSYPFPGTMDDLAVWSRVLTSREVRAIYQGGVAGTSLADVVVPPEVPPTYTAYT